MVKFTSKSEATQACMNSIYYNLRNKISDTKYAEVVKTVESPEKVGASFRSVTMMATFRVTVADPSETVRINS